jgi:endoglucanase
MVPWGRATSHRSRGRQSALTSSHEPRSLTVGALSGARRQQSRDRQGATGAAWLLWLLVAATCCPALPGAQAQSFRLIPERRLVSVATAAPDVLVLVFLDHDEDAPPSQAAADYSVNGTVPRRVGRFSATVCEERCADWRAQRYPQLLQHRLYLALPAPLADGQRCEVGYPGGRTNFLFQSREMVCESFKVNQVGYSLQSGPRAAFFAPWCGDLGLTNATTNEVWLCEAKSGRDLLPLALRPIAADAVNGGPYWRIDLGALKEEGEYFLRMTGAGRSPSFGLGDVYAHHAFYVHMKGLYHQRCGTALTKPFTDWERPACHRELEVTDAPPPDFIKEHGARRIAHVGGHHDAGDFDVRLSHTVVAGWLLNAFELFPAKFRDAQLDLPESGNGIPDLLDEALFSLQAWEVLQEEDGGIRAGFEADRHPTYGEVNAATDKLVYRTFARHGHPTLAGGALMAYAARLVKPFDPGRAAGLLTRAQRAWGFYEKHREDAAYRWSRGGLLFASGQLYLATGEERYHEVFKRQAGYFFHLQGEKSAWPAEYHGTYFNLDTVAQGAAFTHYFASYLLDDSRAKDPAVVKAARAAVIAKADETLKKISGPGFATISTGSWGASTGVGRYGDFLLHAYRLTGEARYLDGARRLADWVLGANPLGRCFTSGLGTYPPLNPLQLDSYFHIQEGRGPVPGLVIYGVTEPPGAAPYIRAVTQHLYPAMAQLPPARRFTDGWSVVEQNEFTVWETLAPNAFLHACLAPDSPRKGRLLPYAGVCLPGGYPARP